MKYLTCKQASEKWKLTVRRVQDLCKSGAVPGVIRHGREWMIPEMAVKPDDGRKGAKILVDDTAHTVDNSHILSLFTAYHEPGSADSVLKNLADKPLACDFFRAQIALYRGEADKAKELVLKYKTDDAPLGLRSLIATILSLCAMVSGDIKLWRETEGYLRAVTCKDKEMRELLDFLIAANASIISDSSLFPPWFRRGDFTPLPKAAHTVARFYYAKYLYLSAHETPLPQLDGRPIILFMNMLPLTLEPLISQTNAEGVLVTELYLRLLCAVAYHVAGEDSLAKGHIEKALDLSLPDRLYLPLAEYRNQLGTLIDDLLEIRDKKAFADVKRLSKTVQSGWIKLHNEILNRTVFDGLSKREQQIAKLAVYGLTNKEIADRLNISVNAVKQALRSTMDKTGAQNRNELYRYV